MNDNQKNTKSVNEFLKSLAEKRAAKSAQYQDANDGELIDPIICNGVADIQVKQPAEESKEM